MRKALIWLLIITFVGSMALLGTGCKDAEAAEETAVEEEATEEAAEETTEEAAEEEEVAEEVTEEENVTLRVFGWAESANVFYELVEEKFYALHPNVTLEFESVPFNEMTPTLVMRTSQGIGPDVALTYSLGQLVTLGIIEDLTDKMNNDTASWDILPDSVKAYSQFGGRTWGPTRGNSGPALFYNKEILDQVGVSYPIKTTDEFLDACQKVKDANLEVGGMEVVPFIFPSYRWFLMPFVWGAGGEEMNSTGTKVIINSAEAIEGLTFLQDMIKNGLTPKPEDAQTDAVMGSFNNGSSAFLLGGPWLSKATYEAGINYGVQVLPGKEEGMEISSLGGACYVVMKDSKHKDLAWDLVKQLADKEVWETEFLMNTAGILPEFWEGEVYEEALKEYPYLAPMQEYGQDFLEVARYSMLENPWWWPEGGDSVQAAFDEIVINLSPVEDTLNGLQAELQQKLDEKIAEINE